MLAKRLAKLATTPIGNVKLGKNIASTHHQGRHHQSFWHANKVNCQVTMTTAASRYCEQKLTTLHQIPQKSPPNEHKREKERGKGRNQPQRYDKCPKTQRRVSPLRGVGTGKQPRETPVFQYSTESTGNLLGKTMLSEKKGQGSSGLNGCWGTNN